MNCLPEAEKVRIAAHCSSAEFTTHLPDGAQTAGAFAASANAYATTSTNSSVARHPARLRKAGQVLRLSRKTAVDLRAESPTSAPSLAPACLKNENGTNYLHDEEHQRPRRARA